MILSCVCFLNLGKELDVKEQTHILVEKHPKHYYVNVFISIYLICIKLFLMNWKSGLNQKGETQ